MMSVFEENSTRHSKNGNGMYNVNDAGLYSVQVCDVLATVDCRWGIVWGLGVLIALSPTRTV